jgi:hypothetical protein
MVVEKPPCPKCGLKQHIICLGGGTTNYYRYHCDTKKYNGCGHYFQEIPPGRREEVNIRKKQAKQAKQDKQDDQEKRPRVYSCSKCGEPKRNHVCKAEENSNKILALPGDNKYQEPNIQLASGLELALPYEAYQVSPPPQLPSSCGAAASSSSSSLFLPMPNVNTADESDDDDVDEEAVLPKSIMQKYEATTVEEEAEDAEEDAEEAEEDE